MNKDLFNKSCELSLDINSEKEDISVSRSRVFFCEARIDERKIDATATDLVVLRASEIPFPSFSGTVNSLKLVLKGNPFCFCFNYCNNRIIVGLVY